MSHTLLGHFTPLGALQTTVLFLAVWWVWVYTSWITNWLNPETDAGPHPAVPADARRARALDLDSDGLRWARFVVRDRLCRDAGRQDRLSVGVDAAVPTTGAPERGPDHRPGYRYRPCSGSPAGLPKARRAWCCGRLRSGSNMSRRRCGSGFRDTAPPRWRTGSSRAATWPSAAPASSSSRSANPSSSPARPLPI